MCIVNLDIKAMEVLRKKLREQDTGLCKMDLIKLSSKAAKVISKYQDKIDYVDVRVVKSTGTLISFRNKKIENVSLPRGYSGSVRALYKGGWGLTTFNDEDELEDAVLKAISHSKKVGRGKSYFAKVKPINDFVKAKEKDLQFTKVTLEEKINVLHKYNKLIWKKGKKVVSSSIYYVDGFTESLFVSSDGSSIIQQRPGVYSMVSVVAQDKGVIQQYSDHLINRRFEELAGKEKVIEKVVDIAEKLTQAPQAKSVIGTVILEPKLTGVFIHEAFGHLSEADSVYENEQLAKIMKLGRRFGSELVTIIDDPTIKGLRGSYIYDAEGVKAEKTYLLKKGVLTGRLHSRETAGRMNEKINGHARSMGVSEPLVRMGVTYIKPGKSSFKQMLGRTREGMYCVGWLGGNTDHENFTFTAAYGVEIKNGKPGRMVRDVKLAGNLFETLKNIDMVGSKLVFEGGTCGKGGQYIANTTGGVHLRIKKMAIMGV